MTQPQATRSPAGRKPGPSLGNAFAYEMAVLVSSDSERLRCLQGVLCISRVFKQKAFFSETPHLSLVETLNLANLFVAFRHRQGLRVLVSPQTTLLMVAWKLARARSSSMSRGFSRALSRGLQLLCAMLRFVLWGNFAIKSGAFVEVKDGALLELHGCRAKFAN